jgi:holo-[acyl-carrier protein] synthase
MSLHVGIDLVSVDQVAQSIADHGPAYLSRVYTDQELTDSHQDPARLAARFAAKEATMKALRRGDEGIGWRSIEIVRATDGQPSIQLRDAAADLARRRGLQSIAVSLTHEPGHAAAVVVVEASA